MIGGSLEEPGTAIPGLLESSKYGQNVFLVHHEDLFILPRSLNSSPAQAVNRTVSPSFTKRSSHHPRPAWRR